MTDRPTADGSTSVPGTSVQEFRAALGAFATGVTIVTTCHDGNDAGLTANSFNSVSLEPPMVLWSLGKSSRSLAHFTGAAHFAVHILAAEQESLSARFAQRGADKFAELPLQRGHGHVPLLTGCVARFQCRKLFEYEGGDHIIFVGQVICFDHTARWPLLVHRGKYAVAEPRREGEVGEAVEASADSLAFLITRAYFALRGPGLQYSERLGVGWAERYVLGTLLDTDGRSMQEVNDLIGCTGLTATPESVQRLSRAGFLTTTRAADGGEVLLLTEAGRDYCLSMIAATKACEADAEMQLGPQAQVLKHLLSRVIATNAGKYERINRHMETIARNLETFAACATPLDAAT
jgi:3-hydroxy-9,10-secoandrosta-1,3,5(10)-triene-9,17-dione monooxygenase reductase component